MGSKNGKGKKKEKHHVEDALVNITNDVFIGKSKTNPAEDYIKMNFIGEGSFASVYRVKNKYTGDTRAMKVIKKSSSCTDTDDQEIVNEINILKKMDHPNVLKIFEFYSDAESFNLVTEFCSGGELFQEIVDHGPFNENISAYIMYQILSAVNYCHNMNIIHRDIKPENILIFQREANGYPLLKICDFGTSKMAEKGATQKKLVGSSYYIAPEVLRKNYNEKCDIWSCGVILYILISGKPPFGGNNDREIMNHVVQGDFDLKSAPFNKTSKEVNDLIKSLLTLDVKKRISAEKALEHNWFKKNKSKELFNSIKDENLIKMFINNLKTYKSTSVIQETALAYLVHNFSQREDIVNACKLFNQIDTSGDGKINKKELYKGLKKRIKSSSLEKDVEIIFGNIDGDNNGYIEYEEFVRAAIDKKSFIDENILRFAFRYFDKDGSGEITFDEIQEVFEDNINDKKKVQEALAQIIKEVDTNGDGIISFEEFASIMRGLIN